MGVDAAATAAADAKEQLDEQEKEAREGIRETTVTRLHANLAKLTNFENKHGKIDKD